MLVCVPVGGHWFIARHMVVVMQLANPRLLVRSLFLSMDRSASPLLHENGPELDPEYVNY